MAKATIEIDDQFTFTWDKTTVGFEAQKRRIPEFVKEFFEKNVSTRTELADDNFYDKYVRKFYDGDTRVKNWAPGVSEKKYKANPEMDSLFLVELELDFRGKKLGGIVYRPELTIDSKIDVKLIEVVEDNEEQCVYNFQLTGSLNWDYKSSHFKKHVEAHSFDGTTWSGAKVDVRINFRDNYEVTRFFKFDEKGYPLDKAIAPVVLIDHKIVGKPEDETNLCFMLDIMPNVLTIVSNDESWKDRKSEYPNCKPINTKNIHMKCKYLNF